MDIKDLNEEQILNILKRGDKIPYYQDISLGGYDQSKHKTAREASMEIWGGVMSKEDTLARALSRGISEGRGFKGSHKTTDILRELSEEMGVDTPQLKFSYDKGVVGLADLDKNIVTLNPEHLATYGREAVIAHELRHLKEAKEGFLQNMDPSIRNILFAKPTNSLDALHKYAKEDRAIKSIQGKALSNFIHKKDRLFENDKLKPSVDALEAYDFLEKGHFKNSFMKENLQRVAKKLPIVGTAATIAGGLGYSDIAGAAADAAIPGGVEETGVSDERAIKDPRYQEYIRKSMERGIK